MKKVAVWLSDEEQHALAQYCEKEGRSMYAVLKEAVARTIQGEAPIAPITPITPKEDGGLVAFPVKAAQAVSPELEGRVGILEKGLYNLAKEVDKQKVDEELWKEVGNLRERVTRLEGMNAKELKKIAVDTTVRALEELGLTGEKRG